MKKSSQSRWRGSSRQVVGGLCVAALAVGGTLAAMPASGTPTDHISRLRDRAEIEELTYCYAEGTDTIGRGDLEGGRAIYETCFAQGAVVEAYFPTDDPDGPPSLTSGPSEWADVANTVFTTNGYVATQHLNSNVRINLQGNTATMTTYLNAVHVIDPEGSIDLANGTYTDTVVRTPQGWKIAKRTLRLITFMRIDSP
ncbi:MAG TPA: nuclear transport factor 2 family protein [Candidatus Nanopelagicales bacterium]|nr:nuclear transport factor 2 family protein [Candidatus Nanopelagicales bacterium]